MTASAPKTSHLENDNRIKAYERLPRPEIKKFGRNKINHELF